MHALPGLQPKCQATLCVGYAPSARCVQVVGGLQHSPLVRACLREARILALPLSVRTLVLEGLAPGKAEQLCLACQ